jgi:hypothetical protein
VVEMAQGKPLWLARLEVELCAVVVLVEMKPH